MTVILHIGLIGSLVLPQLTQPRPKPMPKMMDTLVYWVSIGNGVNYLAQAPAKEAVKETAKEAVKETAKEHIAPIPDTRNIKLSPVNPSNRAKVTTASTNNTAAPKNSVANPAMPVVKDQTISSTKLTLPPTKKLSSPVTTTASSVPRTAKATPATKKAQDWADQAENTPTANRSTTSESKPDSKPETKPDFKPETKPETKPKAEKPDNAAQWQSQFVAAVNRNKAYPNTARKAGIEGSVLIGVHVSADSQIHCYLKKSAGNNQLDNAAVQAANRAGASMGSRLSTSRDFSFDFYVDYVLDN